MSDTAILSDEIQEAPHYQRFVAYTVLLPIEHGKQGYQKVVITGTHKDIEKDLGALLPKSVRAVLSRSDSTEIIERSLHKVESTTPKHDNYYASCSCPDPVSGTGVKVPKTTG